MNEWMKLAGSLLSTGLRTTGVL